jgi:hypothetical protein
MVLLVGALAAFMALDKTILHWYVPESDGSAVRNVDLTPAPTAIVTATTVTPQFTAFEAQALALQWVVGNFGSLSGWDCDQPELNDLQSRWTTVCTERTVEGTAGGSKVITVAVDAITGAATDLETAATAATKTPTNTATATSTKTPQ